MGTEVAATDHIPLASVQPQSPSGMENASNSLRWPFQDFRKTKHRTAVNWADATVNSGFGCTSANIINDEIKQSILSAMGNLPWTQSLDDP
jgi:hypothetical protein